MIECIEVVKDFGVEPKVQHVLKGITLKIEDGDFITIMGKSGSGKTSFLNCLSLLADVTAGQILVDGTPVMLRDHKRVEQIRQAHIGLVFQNANLISCLTALENIVIAVHEDMPFEQKKKAAVEMLARVGLSGKENQPTPTLSGGEMQRVAIARALINHPKLLLCDEPTGALDAETGAQIMELLLQISRSENSALVMVTHDASIGRLGQRQYVMNEGLLHEA